MPSDVLTCFLFFLLPPPRNGGASSGIWVLLERHSLSWNPQDCGSQAFIHSALWLLTSFTGERSLPPTSSALEVAIARAISPAPCSVTLGRGVTLGSSSFSSASSLVSVPLWWLAEIVPQAGHTSINPLWLVGTCPGVYLTRLLVAPAWWVWDRFSKFGGSTLLTEDLFAYFRVRW